MLLCNAEIFTAAELKPLTEISVAEWDRMLSVNVRGVFLCAKAATPHMISNGGGRIINVGSGRGQTGFPNFQQNGASKGAVLAMTRAMASELGEHGINVNAIAPGFTFLENVRRKPHADVADQLNIDLRALKRSQVPEDPAGAAIFLTSDDSAFVTRQSIVVDGGSVMR